MDQRHHQDPFAEIAFREHPAYDDSLREIPPADCRKIYFAPGAERAEKPEEASYEENLDRFHDRLRELRGRYAPYLRHLTPDSGYRRARHDLTEFRFRYHAEEDNRFARVLDGEGEWEKVSVPDFRGPTDERGRWTGYYRTEFRYGGPAGGNRVFLRFQGVDYQASVYLNGKWLGGHEGFFSPFEFDATDLLREENTLVVEVRNDYPMMGVGGTLLDGDKIYAATGPGWDDPDSGWHHCPPGAGIYGDVYLEERPALHIRDLFVRPDIDGACAEVWIDAFNTADAVIERPELCVEIWPKNFAGDGYGPFRFAPAYAGPGMNYFRFRIELPGFRLWEPETPFLYVARVRVESGESCPDVGDRHFGMRKFHMDEEAEPKGTLYFNNRPIILRGANEMGHLQQCVMRRDIGQLIDDILIAKLANMNFYRITQRPVQEEIYDYFDLLGMMHQCDLPTFGHIRRNQFAEAVRQAGEMERLIRSHPSSIMVSLINEPSRTDKRNKGHRYLYRDELEAFFTAARQAIYVENPDRVVKNTDGDYDPPTREGLPDFHCYNMWYTDNGMTVGKMHKGFLPPIKAGWKAGCGEYGTEGLDNPELMLERYPKHWLPSAPDEPWSPEGIVKAQTHALHGDWFAEQRTIGEWIRASQRHQSLATRWMTDAWRRRADTVVSTAVHLLIDAWPAGWMKALVGADRVPKPAYFVYQACLEPVRVHLRADRWRAYGGERLEVEAWLLNDAARPLAGCRIVATLRDDARDYAHYELPDCGLPQTSARYAGTIPVDLPQPAADRAKLYLDACLLDEGGKPVNRERLELEVFAAVDGEPLVAPAVNSAKDGPANSAAGCRGNAVPLAGTGSAAPTARLHADTSAAAAAAPAVTPAAVWLGDAAERLCAGLRLSGAPLDIAGWTPGGPPLVVSSASLFEAGKPAIEERVNEGATVLFIRGGAAGEQDRWEIGGSTVATVPMKSKYTLSVKQGVPGLEWLREDDFSYFYDAGSDRIEAIADRFLEGENLEPLLYGYYYRQSVKQKGTRSVAAERRLGKGIVRFVALPLEGRIGFNPALDRFLLGLLDLRVQVRDGAALAAASARAEP